VEVEPDEVDRLTLELLDAPRAADAGPIEQVKASEGARFTALLHRAHIERSQARATTPASIATLRRGRLREV
jgi:hypothetical protein